MITKIKAVKVREDLHYKLHIICGFLVKNLIPVKASSNLVEIENFLRMVLHVV